MSEFQDDDIHIDDFARGGLLRFIAKRDKVLAWEICQLFGKGRRKEKIDSYKLVYKRLQDRKIFKEAMTWQTDQAIASKYRVTVSYVRAVVGREAHRRLRGELGGRPKSRASNQDSRPTSRTSTRSPQ